jgi:quercetin dioxygenase-like cupin family protein
VSGFLPFDLTAAIDLRDDAFPTTAAGWTGAVELPDAGTHFGYVFAGPVTLSCEVGTFLLRTGMYFAVPGRAAVRDGSGLTITRVGFRGLFQVGGPVEGTGRLRYIDGCTDSLLIPPVLLGDPCLNLLHIPPGTRQTAHTHPSVRVGLIVRGTGECVTPDGRSQLHPGLAFVIPAGSRHSFHTSTDDLLVIAYHPDSDFGPTHECHPMVNRTILGPAVQ